MRSTRPVKERTILWSLTAAAIALRFLLLLGRGDYVAFDEGWYLLLGRNLWSGEYSLSGLQHVALSPLFPILAGAVDLVIGNAIWSGRIVAAVASGLLVLPCWSIFRRLADRTVAVVGSLFVAVLPSLAPFVAPYWIGWDLWVGAEPVLHLLLFTGLALFLHFWEEDGLGWVAGAGVAFGLAYLARPEAIAAFGLLVLMAVGLAVIRFGARRSIGRRIAAIAVCGVAFAASVSPYWLYLHDELDRWTITGRAVALPSPSTVGVGSSGTPSPNSIEDMLWQGEAARYIRSLYSLNASGTALANGYWGIRSQEDETRPVDRAEAEAQPPSAPSGEEGEPAPTGTLEALPEATDPQPTGGPQSAETASEILARTGGPFDSLVRYIRALGIVVPWYVWLFTGVGLLAAFGPFARASRTESDGAGSVSHRRLDLEALVALPLLGTSIAIALVVAIDPRTQLFLAPLVCYYAALGSLAVAGAMKKRMGPEVRSHVATGIVVGALALIMLGTHTRRLYLSLSLGSPHHIVGAENAAVGEALKQVTPPDATIMSWHPAIALYADRDWRVLPLEPMNRIIRYARTQPDPYVVLSVYYPPDILNTEEPHYVVFPVTPDTPESERWRIEIPEPRADFAFGNLVPVEQSD